MKTLQRLFMFMVFIALTLVIGLGIVYKVFLDTPLIANDSGYRYLVHDGASFKSVAADLYNRHILLHSTLFVLLARYRGDALHLKAGEYLFPKGATANTIITQISTGAGMIYQAFMLVPGTTFRQLREQLDKNEALTHTTKNLSNADIMQHLGYAGVNPEGVFYPDTYFFMVGSSDLSLLKRALLTMRTKFNNAWAHRAPHLPFKTAYEALIAASLIEKEAKLKNELPVIAGVLINRLHKNMLLQFDPTVIYGIGTRYTGTIYKSDLLDNNPYNTYLHKGLPPTPISMPGWAAINSVMHPDVNDYLYFVARGDGMSHQFSNTLAAHYVAVAAAAEKKYQPGFFNAALVKQYLLKIFAAKFLANSSQRISNARTTSI